MSKLRSALAGVVGEFHWRPPAWQRKTAAALWRRRKPIGSLVFATLAVTGFWIWEGSRPKPVTVEVRVHPPGITPVAKVLVPCPLIIEFRESAKPLSLDDRALVTDVRLEPETAGEWKWENDRRLRFEPDTDWPADRKYRAVLGPRAVASHLQLPGDALQFRTPSFEARISEIEFYQDPRDPSVKQIVATVDFTHRVEDATVAAHAEFLMLGRRSREMFDTTFDEHHRRAYLRTKPLVLPEREDFAKLTLSPGVRTVQGGARTQQSVDAKTRVPDVYSFFRFDGASTGIAWTDEGDPDQVLTLTSSCAAETEVIGKALSIYLLPPKDSEGRRWGGSREITPDVLAKARKIECETISSRDPQTKDHAFHFRVSEPGQLYVKVERGIRAPGDFVLGAAFDALADVPIPAPCIELQGDGSLLALAGERRLSVRSRGVPEIRYELARVATSQINHLVSQTSGDFSDPGFRSWSFDEENISRIAEERQQIANQSPFDESFSALDLSARLALPADGGSERGLFFVAAQGWNGNTAISDARDSRFLLVTDLGLVVKANADESRDVYVASIESGQPVANALVRVLGKNGVPVADGRTDEQGRVSLPALAGAERDREPVAIVAEFGNDISFIPFERRDRGVNLSRFDVGGDRVKNGAELDAFLFTERGVYRPGDTIHVGYIVRRRDWVPLPAGLPIEIEVTDARGQVVKKERVPLPASGFGEFDCETAPAFPTGVYTARLYLIQDDHRTLVLGSTSPWVKEFLPDRMKISAHIDPDVGDGWLAPTEVKALVSLRNLYGTPAAERTVSARIDLSPGGFSFAKFPEFRFDDPTRRDWTSDDLRSVTLPDETTGAEGTVAIDLHLERFAARTFAMTVSIEGFEAGGGRSVGTQRTLLVSPLEKVVGCRTNGAVDYLPIGTERQVDFLAIDRSLTPVAMDGLRLRLVERVQLSVLKRQSNGNYAYESVEQDRELKNEPFLLPADGAKVALPTERPGEFYLELIDSSGRTVNALEFSVVGKGDGSRRLERNTELRIKLPQREYAAGDEIEVAITAPYTGSGLITLERERVVAQTWFVTDSVNSVQRIRIPDDFEGTGYVNVAFVRGLDSPEIYASPLSCAVEPVIVNREARRVAIDLDVPEKSKPGEPLRIRYRTDRPARIAVFAVDEGILQVTGYELPRPLDHFFRKTALMVETSQIMDLILPEFSVLRSVSASGGDGEAVAKNLNPFRRVTEKPVVFWSGVIDAGLEEREIVYEVPDYFDGTLRVMAVAYAANGTGGAECTSLVRGRFVITPSAPTVAAPGDEFEVGVSVANGGAATTVNLKVASSGHVELLDPSAQTFELAEGAEKTVTIRARALEKLGSAELKFLASADGEDAARRATLSVRPAVPFRTTVRSARFTSRTFDLATPGHPRSEFRDMEATVSATPLGLARGLHRYLEQYPFGCSEQITSAALCRLVLADNVDFGIDRKLLADQMAHTFGELRQRQNSQGGFGYWSNGDTPSLDFVSVYVTQFLVEAKSAGFAPPADMLAASMRNLNRMAMEARPDSLEKARVQAWAIYLLTREGAVTTNAIVNLRDTLDSRFRDQWSGDLTAVYLAGALELMKQETEADRLIRGYRMGAGGDGRFGDSLNSDARYLAVLAREFPERLRKLGAGEFEHVLRPIEEGRFNTLSAALATVALKSYSEMVEQRGVDLGISSIDAEGREKVLSAEGHLLRKAAYGDDAAKIRFRASETPLGAFCQTVESGYDRELPAEPVSAGIEIFREFPKTAKVGEPLTVTIRVRSVNGRVIPDVAIVDLLPGGFEVVGSSITPGAGTLPGWDNVDVREDRVLVFGTVAPSAKSITYQIKPVSAGRFTVPPAFAESMYDRGTRASGVADVIEVAGR